MTRGMRRFQESGQSHFITFSCYRRQPKFNDRQVSDLVPLCLEHYLKLSFAKRLRGFSRASSQVTVQKRDANLGRQAPGIGPKRTIGVKDR